MTDEIIPIFPPLRECPKFYKYVKFEDCMKILTEGTLWYSKPEKFNDPFDCYPFFPEKGKDKVMKRLSKTYSLEKLAPKKRLRTNFNLMSQTGIGGIMHNLVSQNLAVTCFSTDHLSVPMWAHYADDHQGCVIEFSYGADVIHKISKLDSNSIIIVPHHVKYTDDRPPLYDKAGNLYGLEIALSKSSQWAYEKEVRALSQTDGIHHFSRLQITRVFTGVRISKENKGLVKKAIAEMNNELKNRCRMIELSMAFNTYKFVEVS